MGNLQKIVNSRLIISILSKWNIHILVAIISQLAETSGLLSNMNFKYSCNVFDG